MPDAAMTLATLALYADGPSRLTNIGSWRVKETDRLAAMACELSKLGAIATAGADWLEIVPPVHWRGRDRHLRRPPHGDGDVARRIRAASDGLRARPPALALADSIRDPKCVGKTWPDYFETLFAHAAAVADAVPVLAIDGPTASGKGTLASAVAEALGYRYLDSGALYRSTAVAALMAGVDAGDEARLAHLAATLDLVFDGKRTMLHGADVSDSLRLEEVGALASRISAWPAVRAALLGVQLAFPPPARPGRRRPRHGQRRLPGRGDEGLPTAGAATRRAPLQAIDFQGDFG